MTDFNCESFLADLSRLQSYVILLSDRHAAEVDELNRSVHALRTRHSHELAHVLRQFKALKQSLYPYRTQQQQQVSTSVDIQ